MSRSPVVRDARSVRLSVIDSVSRVSIPAEIEALGQVYRTATGSFSLDTDLSQIEIVVRAIGYQQETITVQAGQGDVELEAALSARLNGVLVNVVDVEGHSVNGATIYQAAVPAPSSWPTQEQRSLGTSDENGQAWIELPSATALFATSERAASGITLWEPGVGRLEITLRAAGLLGVRLADSGQSVDGVAITVRQYKSYPIVQHHANTDAGGLVETPLPPGEYRLVHIADGYGPLVGRSGANGGVQQQGEFWISIAADATTWIDVRQDLRRLVVLRDALTGDSPLQGSARIEVQEGPPIFDPPQWVAVAGQADSRSGKIDLSLFESAFDVPAAIRFCFEAPGYSPKTLSQPHLTLPAGTTTEVLLEPAVLRELLLVTQSGEPFLRPVTLISVSEQRQLLRDVPNAEGVIGPFGWGGGDVAISETSRESAPVLAVVPESRIERDPQPRVELGVSAAITVQAGPPGVDALRTLMLADAFQRMEGRIEDGALIFDQLPPGSYEVGPVESLRTISLRLTKGRDALPIRLDAGEQLDLEWNSAWEPPGDIRGKVDVTNVNATDLYIFPRFGPIALPLGCDHGALRFPVDPDGRYALKGLTMTPTALVVGRVSAKGKTIPLDWFEFPDVTKGVPKVRTGTLRLQIVGNALGPCTVRYSPLTLDRAVVGRVQERFDPAMPITLALPLGTASVAVSCGVQSQTVDVVLGEGLILDRTLTF